MRRKKEYERVIQLKDCLVTLSYLIVILLGSTGYTELIQSVTSHSFNRDHSYASNLMVLLHNDSFREQQRRNARTKHYTIVCQLMSCVYFLSSSAILFF
jgi:hypothetical protein